ncbi:hypothetical protein CLV63_113212 [Murinocardiopsis flavida]|uniref:Uncharacterized protein n=1 Tax=Murinocardiopsis flavida TaxID=645275 RepID=A0A2P8DFR9_9ACTN|nr:hypothetical protein CLV63_113212 [Murinocardiopsis flavida]
MPALIRRMRAAVTATEKCPTCGRWYRTSDPAEWSAHQH